MQWGVSCWAHRHGVKLLFARVPQGICTEGCVLHFLVAMWPTLLLPASFVQLFCGDLHRISRTSPLQCIVLPMTSEILWRGVRLAGLVAVQQCTFSIAAFFEKFGVCAFF